jgi:hypothetical protein
MFFLQIADHRQYVQLAHSRTSFQRVLEPADNHVGNLADLVQHLFANLRELRVQLP